MPFRKTQKALLDAIYVYVTLSEDRKKQRINIANRCVEDVARFKYLGTTPSYQNCMHEEVNSRKFWECVQFRVFCHPACCLRI
jgi:hypothetical protein